MRLPNFIIFSTALAIQASAALFAQQKAECNLIPRAVISAPEYANEIRAIALSPGATQNIAKGEISDPLSLPKHIQNGNAAIPAIIAEDPIGGNVGVTYYDLQTNGCMPERVAYHVDGSDKFAQVLWMAATDQDRASVHPTRGSYLGVISVNDPAAPSDNQISWKRMENNRRGGFPSLFQFSDGSVGCVSHIIGSSGSRSQLLFSRNTNFGDETYSSELIQGTTDGLWAHSAIDGQGIIHTIYSFDTSATANQRNNVSYARSTDQGKTWTTPVMLSGVDAVLQNSPRGEGGDGYSIAARNNTVVVAYVDSIYRLVMYKSTDNGATWKAGIIFGPDFQHNVEGANADTVLGDLPDGTVLYKTALWRAPGSSFDVIIDSKDNAHIVGTVFPFFLQGTAQRNGGVLIPIKDTSYMSNVVYYPLGLFHYDEASNKLDAMGEVGGDESWDANGTIYTRKFGQGFSRYPQLGIDSKDFIYCAYSSVKSGDKSQVAGMQGEGLFGHVFATHLDPSIGWSRGKNITPDGFDCLFPSVCNQVDDHIYIAYQADKTPGVSISDANNSLPVEINNIYLYPFAISKLNAPVGVNESTTAVSGLEIAIQPNPASNSATVSCRSNTEMRAKFSLYSALGVRISEDLLTLSPGANTLTINTENLISGVYYCVINSGSSKTTKTLTIAH